VTASEPQPQPQRHPQPRVMLRATDVVKHFATKSSRGVKEVVRAVDGVSLEVRVGESLGLVGESGCGKSTLGRCLVGLTDLTSGSVELEGRDISTMSKREFRSVRRGAQMVFQDPYSSLNPRKRIESIVGLSLRMGRKDRARRVHELLGLVGLGPEHAQRFPHEFSGGQRQRIGIARALAPEPRLIVADEPVSALDVSIQAQVVNLFADLQESLGLSYVFVAHDLSVVRQISDRIAVMYLGKVVEVGPTEELVHNPRHPYTQALLSSVPSPVLADRNMRERIVLEGDVPSPVAPPSGCRFHPRCRYATDLCVAEEPQLIDRGQPGRPVACHYALEDGVPTDRVDDLPDPALRGKDVPHVDRS
jgi:peptide/nickel transport system ATP-binding protein